uniref:DNA primase/polymerase bifunctional N-terminal domain-containing protein n=1 Tax=OCS116 cluster bacterium TaxID=2030921 RepID=A0A2A4YVH0_9PROT
MIVLNPTPNNNIFATHAVDYADQGLYVFPVGGEDGKRPLVKNWRKFGPDTWKNVSERFASDNIGFLNGVGRNPVTIVDIDDPLLIDSAMQIFGETPIHVQTPSKGAHLWYRSNGERRTIGYNGLKIDILGKGGLAVAPPSYRPQKGSYCFVRGSVVDIAMLPKMRQCLEAEQAISKDSDIGTRNDALFKYCLSIARNCQVENELSEAAIEKNKGFSPPLLLIEVQRVVSSVWGYKINGTLTVKGDNKMLIDVEILTLSNKPDALTLLVCLLRYHAMRKTPFAIDQEKMKVILGWGDRRRVSNAIGVLISASRLENLGKGGNTKRAYQYKLMA